MAGLGLWHVWYSDVRGCVTLLPCVYPAPVITLSFLILCILFALITIYWLRGSRCLERVGDVLLSDSYESTCHIIIRQNYFIVSCGILGDGYLNSVGNNRSRVFFSPSQLENYALVAHSSFNAAFTAVWEAPEAILAVMGEHGQIPECHLFFTLPLLLAMKPMIYDKITEQINSKQSEIYQKQIFKSRHARLVDHQFDAGDSASA